MADKKVTAKELAEARDVLDRYNRNGTVVVDVSPKESSHAHDRKMRKEIEDSYNDPMCFCDTLIYRVVMQVLIIGTLIPLHIHLQNNDPYFFFVRYMMGMYGLCLFFEIATFRSEIASSKGIGSISHMVGIVAIILHIRLISQVLAMCMGIPILLWLLITACYHSP
ncbi:unnamed protein product [Thlaspi arvense]|uniref:Uncharacterized protein n=1 Tax=Thlaspi arvense TaxID=13288 RepID=A0AAU9RA04_THLAR|nr:unnamed protein product [Thlaspi arvense]